MGMEAGEEEEAELACRESGRLRVGTGFSTFWAGKFDFKLTASLAGATAAAGTGVTEGEALVGAGLLPKLPNCRPGA